MYDISTYTHCSADRIKSRQDPAAQYCSTLLHTATHCNTLVHSATHCNTLQHTCAVQRSWTPLHTPARGLCIYIYVCIYIYMYMYIYIYIYVYIYTYIFNLSTYTLSTARGLCLYLLFFSIVTHTHTAMPTGSCQTHAMPTGPSQFTTARSLCMYR